MVLRYEVMVLNVFVTLLFADDQILVTCTEENAKIAICKLHKKLAKMV
jgi:hypothetical protein